MTFKDYLSIENRIEIFIHSNPFKRPICPSKKPSDFRLQVDTQIRYFAAYTSLATTIKANTLSSMIRMIIIRMYTSLGIRHVIATNCSLDMFLYPQPYIWLERPTRV